jgi:acyl dehydratase
LFSKDLAKQINQEISTPATSEGCTWTPFCRQNRHNWRNENPERKRPMSTKQPPLIKREQLADYIGKPRESNEWMTITQEMVNAFADATYDHQFIHVDPEKARKTPFGTTIAHGFFTLSLVPKLLESVPLTPEGVVMGVNYGLNRVRFPSPVKTGSDIRVVATLKEVTSPSPDRVVLTTEVVVQVKGESKPALVAESLAMLVFG